MACATAAGVTITPVSLPDGDPAADAIADDPLIADWDEIRADGDIQFSPVDAVPVTREMPEWLQSLLAAIREFFGDVFGPIGAVFSGFSATLMYMVYAAMIVAALYLVYILARPYLDRVPAKAAPDAGWTPARTDAIALLEDADRLAAAGRYDAATHLLLQRSVGQIAASRPDWIDASSTAREIAVLTLLPDNARRAFATIADRVERSLFALQSLGEADWQAARSAYADFALERLDAST